MAWRKYRGIRTRPAGKWRQFGELFEVAGLHYRRKHASRFLKALHPDHYSEEFVPLVARRDPDNRHDRNAIAIDAQFIERRGFWPFRRAAKPVKRHVGFVPAELAQAVAKEVPGQSLAIDFYDYSTDHRGEMAIRCLVLVPGKRR